MGWVFRIKKFNIMRVHWKKQVIREEGWNRGGGVQKKKQ